MSGPSFSQFGDVVSSALDFSPVNSAVDDLTRNHSVMIGQIEAVYPIGHPAVANPELKRFVLFDVRVRHPNNASEIVPFCRMLQPGFGGGINNFMEVLPTDPGPQAQKLDSSMQDKRGHFCLVAFISGHKTSGVILGMMPHTNKVPVANRPKTGLGTHLEGEIQGLHFKIDNDGAFRIEFNGPRKDDGTLVNQNGPTAIQIDRSGNVQISTNKDQSVSIDRVKGEVSVVNGKTSYNMQQEGSKITIECDDLAIKTNQTVKVEAQGKALVSSQDEVTVSAANKINLARGEGTPGEPFVMGKKFVAFMKEFIEATSQITHIGNLGAPTPPPMNAAQISALSQKLDSLLSELIVGEK